MPTPSERSNEHVDGEEVDCWPCVLGTVILGKPSDFPTRSWRKMAPDRKPNTSFENGVPVQPRPGGTVMPYLRSDGEVMRQKEVAEKRQLIKRNANRAAQATPDRPFTH